MITDSVERLRTITRMWEKRCLISEAEARYEIERLRAALQRIDGINDNPAIYNPDIEAVLRAALDEQVAQ